MGLMTSFNWLSTLIATSALLQTYNNEMLPDIKGQKINKKSKNPRCCVSSRVDYKGRFWDCFKDLPVYDEYLEDDKEEERLEDIEKVVQEGHGSDGGLGFISKV